MEKKEDVLTAIQPIFVRILDDENVVIGLTTTANDVENWDSLNHLQLIVAIEKQFRIRFNASEIQGFKTVGDICDSVLLKLK